MGSSERGLACLRKNSRCDVIGSSICSCTQTRCLVLVCSVCSSKSSGRAPKDALSKKRAVTAILPAGRPALMYRLYDVSTYFSVDGSFNGGKVTRHPTKSTPLMLVQSMPNSPAIGPADTDQFWLSKLRAIGAKYSPSPSVDTMVSVQAPKRYFTSWMLVCVTSTETEPSIVDGRVHSYTCCALAVVATLASRVKKPAAKTTMALTDIISFLLSCVRVYECLCLRAMSMMFLLLLLLLLIFYGRVLFRCRTFCALSFVSWSHYWISGVDLICT
mmetsp:Transcript_11642/g.33524  ORF Transcript_11642/g.33524 Transcript_11642/m.33524 type:complete len:273 (+) Transcript_11642:5810-6628(+)